MTPLSGGRRAGAVVRRRVDRRRVLRRWAREQRIGGRLDDDQHRAEQPRRPRRRSPRRSHRRLRSRRLRRAPPNRPPLWLSPCRRPATTAPVITSSAPSTSTSTSTSELVGTAASIVPGINVNITAAILADDEHSYGGSWTAAWGLDDHSGSGVITANVVSQVAHRSRRQLRCSGVRRRGCGEPAPFRAGPADRADATSQQTPRKCLRTTSA